MVALEFIVVADKDTQSWGRGSGETQVLEGGTEVVALEFIVVHHPNLLVNL